MLPTFRFHPLALTPPSAPRAPPLPCPSYPPVYLCPGSLLKAQVRGRMGHGQPSCACYIGQAGRPNTTTCPNPTHHPPLPALLSSGEVRCEDLQRAAARSDDCPAFGTSRSECCTCRGRVQGRLRCPSRPNGHLPTLCLAPAQPSALPLPGLLCTTSCLICCEARGSYSCTRMRRNVHPPTHPPTPSPTNTAGICRRPSRSGLCHRWHLYSGQYCLHVL